MNGVLHRRDAYYSHPVPICQGILQAVTHVDIGMVNITQTKKHPRQLFQRSNIFIGDTYIGHSRIYQVSQIIFLLIGLAIKASQHVSIHGITPSIECRIKDSLLQTLLKNIHTVRTLHYLPLIPQEQGMFRGKNHIQGVFVNTFQLCIMFMQSSHFTTGILIEMRIQIQHLSIIVH